jgi:hypothetical protein
LATVAIYSLVFSYFLKIAPPVGDPSGLDSFALFLLCALIPWRYVTGAMFSALFATDRYSSVLGNVPIRPILLPAVLVAVATVAVVAVVSAFAGFDVSLSDGVGDRTYAPASAAGVRHEYKLGVGNLDLDLSRVQLAKELHVEARVGIGKLRVIVPRGASVVVDSRVKAGSVSALGRHDDRRNARVRITGGNKLYLKARVGAGRIDVGGG